MKHANARGRLSAAVFVLSIGLAAALAHARPSILADFRDHYPTTTIPDYTAFLTGDQCLDCHVLPQRGTPGNAYRIQLIATGHDFAGLDPVDSDGDGVANAVEATTPRVDEPLEVAGAPQVGYNLGLIDCPDGRLGYDPFSMQVITGAHETPPGGTVWSNESVAANCDDGLDNDCDGLKDAADPDCAAPPPGAGAVPDGFSRPGVPLQVAKGPGDSIDLSWSASCQAGDSDYEVYEGTIGDYYSHGFRLCSTGGATSANLVPAHPGSYYLVVPATDGEEGSYGLDSGFNERPPGMPACLARLLAAPVCP